MISEQELLDSSLLHRSLDATPAVVSRASGSYIYLEDGRKILDGCGGAAVISVGHGNKEVIDSVTKQLNKISYASSTDYTTGVAEDLANMLLADYKDVLSKVYFANSGSEANEAAIKAVTQYFFVQGKVSKTHFISRRQSYHGNCLGGMSLSGHVARRAPFEKIIPSNFHQVSPAFEFRYKKDNESTEDYTNRLCNELEDEILSIGPENVAAFFAETIVGATTGCVTAPANYFKKIREICDKYDVLLVLDEVMCGSGRTGTFFAWEQEGVIPDITTSGKALTSGYGPLSAVIFNKKVTDVLRKAPNSAFNSGHTYQCYPLACAAGLSVQKIIKRDLLLKNVIEMGEYLSRQLKSKLSHYKIVGDIRGRGLFWGVEFVKDKSTNATFDHNFGSEIQQAILAKGVAVYPGHGTVDGYSGDHIIIAPSFDVTRELIDEIVEVVSSVIETFAI